MKFILILIALGSMLFAKNPPLSFIALEDENWHVVVCDDAITALTKHPNF